MSKIEVIPRGQNLLRYVLCENEWEIHDLFLENAITRGIMYWSEGKADKTIIIICYLKRKYCHLTWIRRLINCVFAERLISMVYIYELMYFECVASLSSIISGETWPFWSCQAEQNTNTILYDDDVSILAIRW